MTCDLPERVRAARNLAKAEAGVARLLELLARQLDGMSVACLIGLTDRHAADLCQRR